MTITRRHILLSGAALATLTLPGCQSLPAFSLTEAIRRLLALASQNAFALLLQPGGFYDSSVARIALPDRFGGDRGAGILSVVLQSRQFRDRLQRQLNRAAEKGAERAAPLVADAVRNVSIEDAAALVRGGPQAATAFLRGKMGPALLELDAARHFRRPAPVRRSGHRPSRPLGHRLRHSRARQRHHPQGRR